MDFYDLLDQVIALIKQRGRASYRALKVQFHLDDESLEALKEELIKVHQLARDHNGEMLVWTGDTATAQAVAPQPAQTIQPPAAQRQQAPQAPEAERRQLTVMFCDLVDSTKLSSQLDPEDWREVVREYQRVCTDVIQRYDGHIAQLLGDGLLVYVGYPQAHEDDPQRAVRAALGILAAVGNLNSRLQQAKGIQLAVRIGIHTGLVVVGAMGGAGRQEQLALGETPNIAARLQGLTAPNTVAISDATYRLVQGYFQCQDLGAQALRGVTEAMRVYHVLGESGATSRLEVAQPRGLTPLVGRESEVTLLLERWAQVKAGQGHVVLLTGDAGIGKSRLVQVLKDHVATEPHVRWECRSLPYYQNTALYPIVDLLHRILRWQPHHTPEEKLATLLQELSQYRLPVEESVQLFAPVLSLPLPENTYFPLNLSPQRHRQKTLETLVANMLEQAERHPVLFIVEDLHWTDPTTLELLNLLIDQTPTASMLVLLTCRPYFQPAWHHRSYLTEMTLNHLSHAQVAQIVHSMTEGKTLPPEVLAQIVAKTDGVPLFVEEMTKALLESGQLTARDGHYELIGSLSTLAIPATLQDSLMARLDRLVSAKGIAQLAAVIGRQFAYALLQAVSQLDALTLQRELGCLVEAELVYQRGLPPQATFTFKHALIQDAAYQSLLHSTRQQYHQRIAQVLEAQFPDLAEMQPELVAQHYTAAGCTELAVVYWQRAGQHAIERSAHVEAIAHLTRGLEVLKHLPDTPERTQQELHISLNLGGSLIATMGSGSVEVVQAYTHAWHLCQSVGTPTQHFLALSGLWLCAFEADMPKARMLGEQLLPLAQQAHEPVLRLAAHRMLGTVLFHLGEIAAAHRHLEQALAFAEPQQHRYHAVLSGVDMGVAALGTASWALWFLGYPDQALTRSRAALARAQELAHPYSLVAYALRCSAVFQQFRRETSTVQAHAETMMMQARTQGFPQWEALGLLLHGWALVMQGQADTGLAQLRQGIDTWRATGVGVAQSYHLVLLAEAFATSGQPEAGLAALGEALAQVDATGERFYEAELYRCRGELLQQAAGGRPQAAEVEAYFHQALAIARRQQAKSLELRAAMSLARLWQQQGKRDEARALLAPIYGWFTEGFDTADLQEAKALLDALA